MWALLLTAKPHCIVPRGYFHFGEPYGLTSFSGFPALFFPFYRYCTLRCFTTERSLVIMKFVGISHRYASCPQPLWARDWEISKNLSNQFPGAWETSSWVHKLLEIQHELKGIGHFRWMAVHYLRHQAVAVGCKMLTYLTANTAFAIEILSDVICVTKPCLSIKHVYPKI